MDNKVYYGEYSLRHWVDLVLKANIILPDYQRYFVWNEKKVQTLINTFKGKEFIPPVTIGAYKINGINQNLILDGQQRITSILLAYLGLYPDKQIYKSKMLEKLANNNDDEEEEEEESLLDNILEWNLKSLTEKGNSKETILSNIIQGNYKIVDFGINESFLETNFLGFSYLVPQTVDEKTQQKYYSSVFRNINIQGEPLLAQESRASLYFLDRDLEKLFSPDFCNSIIIKLMANKAKVDFVRYLSLLSQYHKNGNEHKVARGYKQNMEKFYEEYIYAAISDEDSETYCKFSDIFQNKKYENKLSALEKASSAIGLFGEYSSIIDVDTYLFGLIYYILFKEKHINSSNKDALKERLDNKILEFKTDASHAKSPNNLGHLRSRIGQSIEIYGKYIANES